ncbi:hypothetical protein ACET3X_007525 [Alternaria dauci]|uniref:NmrA-like domain-containing protein n=1 Tax=Alternaria dauci TaxID=48095 RepID=A0ABR3UEP6_9PLEO
MSKRVAISGGSGNVAQEVIDAIVSRDRYKVVVLSRRDAPAGATERVEWRKVDYHNHASLIAALDGIDTLLSFVATTDMDAAFEFQKLLIQAAIEAGQIEYCLFQPGFFTEYFAAPHRTAKHFHTFKMFADFEYRRAIILEGSEDAPLTLTTVEDMAKVVALALEYTGKWPTVGGFQGTQTTLSAFLSLAESIRGPFQIE